VEIFDVDFQVKLQSIRKLMHWLHLLSFSPLIHKKQKVRKSGELQLKSSSSRPNSSSASSWFENEESSRNNSRRQVVRWTRVTRVDFGDTVWQTQRI